MKKKKLVTLAMTALLTFSMLPSVNVFADTKVKAAEDVLFDDFEGESLDTSKWLIAHKKWGGDNGGVVKENVSVSDGTLKLEGHGLKYTGDVPGIKKPDGTLTGAAIATREYYSSGSYEVVAKVAPDLGACSALWTFEYEEYYPGDENYDPKYASYGYCTVNHEIDIEIPTGTNKNPDPNFSSARFNTYQRENKYTPHYHDLEYAQNDGRFHTYRFDWHTGDDEQTPRVEFYIDNQLLYTSTKDIPTNAGRFWIGVWFPYSIDSDKDGKVDTGWSGLADFDTTVFEIDSVKITPYHEANDTEQHETYGYDGWAPNSFPETNEKEKYEHLVNGDFSQGETGWTLEDDAKIEDGVAKLTSGQVADSVSQIVEVVPCATYTVTAHVETDGTPVIIGACKENGSKDQSITVTQSGDVKLTFNNETSNTTLKVYAKVDRWKGNDVKVSVSNISIKGDDYVEETQKEFTATSAPGDGSKDPQNSQNQNQQNTDTENPEDQKTEDQKPEARVNLVSNGDFEKGEEGWSTSGSAVISDGIAKLASGNDTDKISQTVKVEKGQTYTLSADITSKGSEIEFGVKDYNGKYTTYSEKYTQDGKYKLTFQVASHIDQIEVFANVVRYQENKETCTIDNIVLVKGTEAFVTVPEDPKDDPKGDTPAVDDPVKDDPKDDSPAVDDPVKDDPKEDTPAVDDPVSGNSTGVSNVEGNTGASGSNPNQGQTTNQNQGQTTNQNQGQTTNLNQGNGNTWDGSATNGAGNTEINIPSQNGKKAQKITTARIKKIEVKTLQKKSVKLKLKAKTNGKGKLTYKVVKFPKKMKNYIKVSKKGVVTLKKNAKKGTYKIRITAAAKGDFKKTTKVITIKVK